MIRICDILFSSLALLALLPFFIVVACVLKFTGEGEVFFRQCRVGWKGNHFSILKFATMLKDSPNMGAGTITLDRDPRILPVGHMLRRTKINELPQLWNVFVGQMSLIGPRPQAAVNFDAFSASAKKQLVKVRPGISGIGSLIFRSEEKMLSSSSTSEYAEIYSGQIMRYKGEVEAWYVKNQSLGLYFLLIFLTVWYVINPNTNVIHSFIKTLPKASPDIEALIRSAS